MRPGSVGVKLSPEKKLEAAMRLYWSAREIKAAMIARLDPSLSKAEIARRVREWFLYARQ